MPKAKYYPALTGVRALAAYGVFVHHFYHFPEGSLAARIAMQGGTGVTVFFVLSGFLICNRYFERLTFSAAWLGTYFRNRVARIYPLYLLLTLLTFASIIADPGFDPVFQWSGYVFTDKVLVIGLNLTLLRGFFEQFIYTGISQGWTLTVEESFYFLAPALLLGVAHFSSRPFLLLMGYAALFLAAGALLVHAMPHRFGFFNSYTFALGCTFFGQCTVFFIGIVLALLVKRMRSVSANHRPFWTTAGALWAIACLVLNIVAYHTPADHEIGIVPNSINALSSFLLFPIGVAMFFWGLINECSWVQRVLQTPALQLLGKSSYAFYLIHIGICNLLLVRYVTASIPVRFMLLLGLAIVLYKYVEDPLHKWVKGPMKEIEPIPA